MRIALSGSTGLVGSALKDRLIARGDDVFTLVRRRGQFSVSTTDLEGNDAIVHLAGESIASGRWTLAKKARIRDSRWQGTEFLAKAAAQLKNRPRVFLSASAIGFYGNRGIESLTETSASGTGFLPEVCRGWENATRPAAEAGIRTAQLRFGIILSSKGGALGKMLVPFKLGLGGKVGSGNQMMSWVALEDVIEALLFALDHPQLEGPVNVTAPAPVSNLEFTKTLGKILSRPTYFPMPAFAARLVFGEMADALLLSSSRVIPRKLLELGFKFKYPELKVALESICR